MATIAETMQTALKHHQEGDLQRAESLYREVMRVDPRHSDALHLMGLTAFQRHNNELAVDYIQRAIAINHRKAVYHSNLGTAYRKLGKVGEAVDCLRQAVELQPEFVDAHLNLGLTYAEQCRWEDAARCYQRVIHLDSRHGKARNNLGLVLLKQGKTDEAVDCYRQAVELNSNDADALANLGLALREQAEFDEAIVTLRRALELNPGSVPAWSTLAKILHRQGRFDEAVGCFQEALKIKPNHPGVHYHLGNVLKEQEKLDEAIASYERALAAKPDYWEAEYDLGNALKRDGQLDRSRASFESVLKRKPGHPPALICLANVLKTQDHIAEAADCYREVLKLAPKKPVWELWVSVLCPSVFTDAKQIVAYRETLMNDLSRVAKSDFTLSAEEVKSYACPPPYELPFHGLNDRSLKEAYANIYLSRFTDQQPPTTRTGRPSVGFVVTTGHEGIFVRCMKGVLERIDPDLFEIVIVCSAKGAERISKRMCLDSIRTLVISYRFEAALETIRQARFDVLYYFEIGSDATNYFLPFFTPAPIQCTGWGVPVTSGNPRIDYYLSNRLVEPLGAPQHYTETLVMAKTLLSRQERLPPPESPKDREAFGFSKSDHLYLCTQQVRKIHPDFDEVLAAILRRDNRGVVVLFEDRQGHAAKKLRDRFSTSIPDVVDRVAFLPFQKMPEYLSLLKEADVVLDTLHFAGGLTTYDALSFNKPIVTLPMQFRRSRYAFGCYQLMGIDDCIAATTDEYIEIALSLGNDDDRRRSLESRITAASSRVFENDEAVSEYERIFQLLIEQSRLRGS